MPTNSGDHSRAAWPAPMTFDLSDISSYFVDFSEIASYFCVDRQGIIHFASGQRVAASEIQSVAIVIRRSNKPSLHAWATWLVAGLIVSTAIGIATIGRSDTNAQSLVLLGGLLAGIAPIALDRKRKEVFIDLQGLDSLITSLRVGPSSREVEAKAYGLADVLIALAKDNP